MKVTGAQLLVEWLKTEGVKHVFGVSGSPLLPVMDIFFHDPAIQYIQTQHEQGSIFMANGYARATRHTGVCLVGPGPGATNCLSGVGQAFYTSTSSLLISIDSSNLTRGLGTSLHHDLESIAIFAPVTKLAFRIDRLDRLQEGLQRAFRIALTGRRGPVFLGISKEILTETIEIETLVRPRYRLASAACAPKEIILKAADLLTKAHRPVALVGGGLLWADAQKELIELAERLAMPVATSRDNKGFVPDDHPLSIGELGFSITPPAQEIMQTADVLLAVGCTFGEFTTKRFSNAIISKAVKIIQIDIDPTEIGKIYPVELGIHGDCRCVLDGLIQTLKERNVDRRPVDATPRIKELMQRKKSWRESLLPLKTSDKSPILWPRLLYDLRQALPRDAIVSAVSGSTHEWFTYAFEALVHTCSVGGWHPLGSEYPESLGVKVALPDRPVVCLIGDGALMMTMQEMATAAAYNIPMLCIVARNGVYGNMRHSQIKKFDGRFLGTDVPMINIANVAREFGIHGERVEDPAEIIPAVGRALDSKKASLLEVMIDASEDNLMPL